LNLMSSLISCASVRRWGGASVSISILFSIVNEEMKCGAGRDASIYSPLHWLSA
jgi:hypothetical protein